MSYQFDDFIKKLEINQNEILNESNLKKDSEVWMQFILMHPADIADILENIKKDLLYPLFNNLPPEVKADVFMEFSEEKRHYLFAKCKPGEREILLGRLTIDELVDFFDDLSDVEVSKYIKLLNKKEREKVLSLLEFPETSAAGVMDSNVFVLPERMNVFKTINLLQRLKPDKILYKTIFIVDQKRQIIGSIFLEDLVLHQPTSEISSFMKPVLYKVNAETDQSDVASYMTHYNIDIVPVVDKKGVFLGVIQGNILAHVLESEASEDIFRMASLSPIKTNYFEVSMFQLIWQRCGILSLLLLLQSFSSTIISSYTSILTGFLITYIGMITSTGGNASSQVSALVIQGLYTGELKTTQMIRFIKREICIASFLGLFLGIIGFIRTYIFNFKIHESFIVGLSLFLVVIISTFLGSIIPFILRKLKIDPAYSAGPILSTCMDLLGVIIFTLVSIFILKNTILLI
jgi:magnesium transporter